MIKRRVESTRVEQLSFLLSKIIDILLDKLK